MQGAFRSFHIIRSSNCEHAARLVTTQELSTGTLNDERKYMAGDVQLTCSDCGREFTFTSEDQAFFRERGYSTPKRCKPCRQAKKNEQMGGGGGGGGGYRAQSQGTSVVCSGCGQQTTVPFEPRGDRPVYCRDCYQAQKGGSGGGGGRGGRGRY